ncbi:unnamed protein product [Clonostachys solani]|uniref:Uncharacterized protein n=1 Tax=Clonostachys solani TaxID=160281 RepID=A0A9N9ZLE4_9HYPO|nr:unnamed protein product [Clonostachys solani]
MTGVPKSRACAPCKARRTKCFRKRQKCPGPSSLLKFININTSQQPRRRQTTQPRSALLSPTDLVAGRLVHHIDGAKERMVIHIEPFKYLPARLGDSACLLDASALLCNVWDIYRRNEKKVPLSHIPAYGKAIHSLARTLESDNAYTVDTLAAVTVIQQAELYFDHGNSRLQHEKGFVALLSGIGPPKPGDKLHARLGMAAYVLLLPHWIALGGGTNVFDTPEWISAFAGSVADYLNAENLKPFLEDGFVFYNTLCARLPQILQATKAASAFRLGLTTPRPYDVTRLLQGLADKSEQACSEFLGKMKENGLLKEEEDPESPFGLKYWVPTPFSSQFLLGLLTARLIILLANLKWNAIHGNSEEAAALFATLRTACFTIWRFIPFLRDHDLLTVPLPWQSISSTFAFANTREKDYMLGVFEELDLFQRTDNDRRKVPRSRASIEKEINQHAGFMSMQQSPSIPQET